MDGFEKARRKIEECEKHKHRNVCCIGPTGPTGPTARLFKSSNKNNHRFKLNNSL